MKSNANATPKVERREERDTRQRKARRRPVRVPINRHALGRRNETVAAVRDYSLALSHRKQTGRRYGPQPKGKRETVVAGRAPLATSKRVHNYQRQNGRLLGMSTRQLRQINRMSLRSARRGQVSA